jgi:hypothetical protein
MDIRRGAYRERVVVWADGPAQSPILPRRALARALWPPPPVPQGVHGQPLRLLRPMLGGPTNPRSRYTECCRSSVPLDSGSRVRRGGDGYLRFRGREDRTVKGVAVLLALANHDPPSGLPPPSCLPRSTGFGRRPLSWYFRAPRSAGLAVTALEEPEPTRRGSWPRARRSRSCARTVPLRRPSAQTAGAPAPRSGHRSRRPGGSLAGRRTNFYQHPPRSLVGRKRRFRDKKGRPGVPNPRSTIHEGEYPYIAQTIVVADPTEGLPRGRFWPHRTGFMRDPASELRRITLLGRTVNRA